MCDSSCPPRIPGAASSSHGGRPPLYCCLRTGAPCRENPQSHTGPPRMAAGASFSPGGLPADVDQLCSGYYPWVCSPRSRVHTPEDFSLQIRPRLRGAAPWLFLAPCHFIYEVLVFDKRISFMQISGFFLPDYQPQDPALTSVPGLFPGWRGHALLASVKARCKHKLGPDPLAEARSLTPKPGSA